MYKKFIKYNYYFILGFKNHYNIFIKHFFKKIFKNFRKIID